MDESGAISADNAVNPDAVSGSLRSVGSRAHAHTALDALAAPAPGPPEPAPLPAGVPPGLRLEDVYDGRCFALLHGRDPQTNLHFRCTYPASEGQFFCSAYHRFDRDRAAGTVWQHKSRCTACYRDKAARFREQPPPHMDMRFAPDRPSRRAMKAAAVAAAAAAAAEEGAMAADPATWNLPGSSPLEGVASELSGLPSLRPRNRAGTRSGSADGTPMSDMAAETSSTDAAAGGGGPDPMRQDRLRDVRSRVACDTSSVEGTALGKRSERPSARVLGEARAPVNSVLDTPKPGSSEWEHEFRYAGPSGIKIRIRLASVLQPANWCVEPEPFHSCLHAPSPKARSGAAAAAAELHKGPEAGPIDLISDSSGEGTASTATGAVTTEGEAYGSGTSAVADDSLPMFAVMEDILSASLSVDLDHMPISGDSWLTSPLIDFVAFTLARKYPNVHFLPTNFMAFELPNACKSAERLREYAPQDLLGRTVHLANDAIPPVVYDSDAVTLVDASGSPSTGLPNIFHEEEQEFRRANAPAVAAAVAAALYTTTGAVATPLMPSPPLAPSLMPGAMLPYSPAMSVFLPPHERVPTPASYNMLGPPGHPYMAGLGGHPMDTPTWTGGLGAAPGAAPSMPFSGPALRPWGSHLTSTFPPPIQGHDRPYGGMPAMMQMTPFMTAMVQPSPAFMPVAAGAWSLPDASLPPAAPQGWPPTPWLGDPAPAPSTVPPTGTAVLRPRELGNVAAMVPNVPSPALPAQREPPEPTVPPMLPFPVYQPHLRHDTPPHYTGFTLASSNKPLVFFWNIGNMHWNLIRVLTGNHKRIEIYEPMGKLTSRSHGAYKPEGLSLRSVPRHLIEWLDTVCPLPTFGGWRSRTYSAITAQQQGNGFDCGVACLLYAEKCGQGREKEDICQQTDQDEITEHRALLRKFFTQISKSHAR